MEIKIGTKEQIENELKELNAQLEKEGVTIITIKEYSNYIKSLQGKK